LKSWPQSWDEVLEMSRERRVLWPLKAVHALMSFYTLCAGSGHPCATSGSQLIDRDSAERVLELLRRFAEHLPEYCFELNPIGIFHWMNTQRSYLYVPLIYGYVTYSRAPAELEFGDIPQIAGSTLGGTGIAVSARSKHRDAALAIARDLASAATQRGLYAHAGGQPAHRSAWTDDRINADTQNFYRNTLATLDASYLRPRFNGYIAFQHKAGALVAACAEGLIPIASTIDRLNDLFAVAQGLK
jgi:multiple sugar transport system substrate-binding protein